MLPAEQFPHKTKLYSALILQDLLKTLLCSGGLLFSQLLTGFKIPSLPTAVHADCKMYHLLHCCSKILSLSFRSTAASWRHSHQTSSIKLRCRGLTYSAIQLIHAASIHIQHRCGKQMHFYLLVHFKCEVCQLTSSKAQVKRYLQSSNTFYYL